MSDRTAVSQRIADCAAESLEIVSDASLAMMDRGWTHRSRVAAVERLRALLLRVGHDDLAAIRRGEHAVPAYVGGLTRQTFEGLMLACEAHQYVCTVRTESRQCGV